MKYVKYIDFLSPQINLKIKSMNRFQNAIGGCFSVVSALCILATSFYFTIETFSRENCSTMFSQDFSDNPNFNMTGYPVVLSMLDIMARTFNDSDTLFSIQGLYYEYIRVNGKLVNKIVPVPVFKCTKEYFGKYYHHVENLQLDKLYCVNTTGINLYGDFGAANPWGVLAVTINKCVNNTQLGKVNCQPEDVIQTKLSQVSHTVLVMDYLINHKNYSNPGSPYLSTTLTSISSTIYKRIAFTVSNIIYNTDYGFVFQDIFEQDYFSIKMISESVDNRKTGFLTEGAIANHVFSVSTAKSIYHRRYSKLQDLLANIGGVIKGILFVSMFVENYLIHRLFLVEVCNEIFEIDVNSSKNPLRSHRPSSKKVVIPRAVGMKSITEIQLVRNTENKNSEQSQNITVIQKLKRYIKYIILTFLHRKNSIKSRGIKLSFWNYIFYSTCLKAEKLSVIDGVEKYLNNQTSIERIIKRINEIKTLKHLIFSKDEKNLFNFIRKPLLSTLEKPDKKEDQTTLQTEQTILNNIDGVYKDENRVPTHIKLIEQVLKYLNKQH